MEWRGFEMDWKDLFPKENRYFETEKGILYCGDCLEIMLNFPLEFFDMIYLDPPYNCGLKNFVIKEKSYKRVCEKWDSYSKEDYKNFIIAVLKNCKKIMAKGASILVSGMFQNIFDIFIWLRDEIQLDFRNFITWFKPNAMPIKFAKQIGVYAYSCEYICYFSKGRVKTFNYELAKKLNGGNQQRDLFIFKVCQDIKMGHPTQKPLNLIKYLIKIHSKENDLILDPFLGSGTTAVACEQLNRKWIGIEINPEYCEIAKKRILKENKQMRLF